MYEVSVERQEENEAFIKFIEKESEEAKEPLSMNDKIKEFIERSGSDTNVMTFKKFIQRYKPKIREIKDEGKRARQLFGFGVSVDEKLFEELEQHANVSLNGNGKIVKYESHDGSLTLNGSYSQSNKMKNQYAEKRRRQMALMDNGEGEEEEEDEAPEPPATKKTRVSVPIRVSGSRQAVSSASQLPTSSNSVPQPTSASQQRVHSNTTHANRPTLSSARQLRQSERARIPTGVNSGTPQAEVNQSVAGEAPAAPVKIEDPEHQNIFEPNDVKPDLQYYQGQQPPREGILSLAAHKSFITNIQTLISIEKLPIDQDVVLKLGQAKRSIERVEILGAPNQNEIQIDDFVAEILHTVSVARRNSSDFCAEESRSLRDFLLNLRFSIASLWLIELEELETKLVKAIEDPGNLNKRIPVNRIENVMRSILDLLMPN